jgi:hypothetical protein
VYVTSGRKIHSSRQKKAALWLSAAKTLFRELKASPPRNAAEPKSLPFFCRNLSRFCQVHFVAAGKNGYFSLFKALFRKLKPQSHLKLATLQG